MISEKEEALEKKDELLFDIRRSIRYHNYRRDFFETFQTSSQIISALLGTATFTSLLTTAGRAVALTASAITTVFSVIGLVIGPSKKALVYADLSKRFINLQGELVELPSPTTEGINSIIKKRLEIEKDEPPILKTLDSFCHNEEVRAGGYDEGELVVFKWYHRLLKNIIDVNTQSIRKINSLTKKPE